MREAFRQRLANLEEQVLRMGGKVEEAIGLAVRSLVERDLNLAQRVIDQDDEIDRLEMEIERESLALLALQQPLASDLRVVGTALKIITDLERMADHAVDIAKTTKRLGGEPLIKPLIDIPRMAELAQTMTHEALEAFVQRDVALAASVIRRDDVLDSLYHQVFRELLLLMMEDHRTITQGTYLLFVARYLERIADHATNLGERTIYMVTGERSEIK